MERFFSCEASHGYFIIRLLDSLHMSVASSDTVGYVS